MKKLLICTSMLVSSLGFAGSIWEPASTCKTKQFGVWYSCPNLPDAKLIEFTPDKVTPTTSEFIKSLPILDRKSVV